MSRIEIFSPLDIYIYIFIHEYWETDLAEFSKKQSDKLQTLIKAANVPDVEPIWSSLFAKVR